MTSLRFRIVFLVLALCLGEAFLLGTIGYSSVRTSARNVGQFEEIVSSLEETRALIVSLSRAGSQVQVFSLERTEGNREAVLRRWAEADSKLKSCSSASCHGIAQPPARMLDGILPRARRVREELERVARLPPADPEVSQAIGTIGDETEEIVALTGQMAEKVLGRVRRLGEEIRSASEAALALVAAATLGAALVATLLTYPLVNAITRNLHTVVEAAGRFAAGDLAHRVPETGGKEPAVLAGALNQMAAALETSRDQLRGELRSKEASLSRSERLATLGLLASTVAHELNNPLTAVMLKSRLALERTPGTDPVRPMLDEIVANTERCRRIVADLRVMAQQHAPDLAPCDLPGLLADAVRLASPRAEARRVELKTDVASGAGAVCACDRQRLLQVLLNLMDNAVAASPEGGAVTVRLRKAVPSGAVVEVEDRGPGIPPEQRQRLFEPFFTTKPGGLGLGLAISKHLVEDHGGRIEFETLTAKEAEASGRAPGTVFRVRLNACS